MKKFTILLFAAFSIASVAVAQFNVTLKLGNNTDVTNATIDNNGISGDLLQEYIIATNHASNVLHMKVKKEHINVIAGTEDLFCWKACYSASTFISPDTIWLAQGGSYTMIADYKDNGNAGTSTIKYVFFDENFPTDSVYVIVNFKTSGVGIEEAVEQSTVSNAYPNPAKDMISFNYTLANASLDGKISIYDILGKVVKTESLDPNANKVSINLNDIEKGVYFYSFVVNGKKLVTKRLVVAH